MVAQSCGIDYYAVILRVSCQSITTPSQVSMRDTVGQQIGTYGFARNALYSIHTSAGFIAFQGEREQVSCLYFSVIVSYCNVSIACRTSLMLDV